MTEILHVVPANAGDACADGIHDVRGIQSAAESRFDERDVYLGARERVERQRGRGLEEGRAELLDERRPALDEFDDRVRLNRNAGDEDALAKIDEVW